MARKSSLLCSLKGNSTCLRSEPTPNQAAGPEPLEADEAERSWRLLCGCSVTGSAIQCVSAAQGLMMGRGTRIGAPS